MKTIIDLMEELKVEIIDLQEESGRTDIIKTSYTKHVYDEIYAWIEKQVIRNVEQSAKLLKQWRG